MTIKSKQIWSIMTAKKDSAQPNTFRLFLHRLTPILLYLFFEAKKRRTKSGLGIHVFFKNHTNPSQ